MNRASHRTSYPHLIRERFSIDQARYEALGGTGVQRLMDETEARAITTARTVGIERVTIRAKHWELDGLCTYHPMYLCGPDAPRINGPEDVFRHVWHLDNPWAAYEVVVEDQDLLDQKEREWMDGLVAQAREKGLQSLVPTWAPNVIERVRLAMQL